MKSALPQEIRACLWSYDTSTIDPSNPAHRTLIIKNVLNNGTSVATDWLFATYSKEEIQRVIEHSIHSEWSKKSIALWSLVFGVTPLRQNRFV
ncbi:MAG: hypothetical protein Q8P93_01440 [bacterium]|nr:hypothetical protein [bacterium]